LKDHISAACVVTGIWKSLNCVQGAEGG